MQLDKTFIAVRERDPLEILDLSLHVVRAYFLPLAAAFVVGILPMALLSHLLLHDWFDVETESQWRVYYAGGLCYVAAFAAPLAGAPATLLLGQTLFTGRPNGGRIAQDLVSSLPQMFLLNVVVRGILYAPGVLCFLPSAFWPYLTEIVLLERNPLSGGGPNRITTWRRSKALHSGSSGDLFGRWMITIPLAALLAGLLLASLWGMHQWIVGVDAIDRTTFVVYAQIAVWTTVAFFTVVRFLSYLDLRIRREGWEVELKMRAEGAILEQELV